MIIRPSRIGLEISHHKLRQMIDIWGKSAGITSMHGFNFKQNSNLHSYLQGAANALDYSSNLDESNAALKRQIVEVLGMVKENYQVIIELEKE